ncbi:MAG: acyl-CoA thioesterase [Myxococcota bacterium]
MVEAKGRAPSVSAVEMHELVLPGHANALGTAFGGTVMGWVDICAAMAAQRHARKIVVTAAIDAVDFFAPIRVGHVVNLKAMVNFVGRTSMEVGVRVESEDPLTGERVHTMSAYLTFVAIDADGRPCVVTPLSPETADERLRYAEAQARRRQRLALAGERRRLAEQHRED